MHYKDGTKTMSFELPPEAIPYMEEAEKRIEIERKIREEEKRRQEEQDKKIMKNKPSATEIFYARFAKHKHIKDSKTPTK